MSVPFKLDKNMTSYLVLCQECRQPSPTRRTMMMMMTADEIISLASPGNNGSQEINLNSNDMSTHHIDSIIKASPCHFGSPLFVSSSSSPHIKDDMFSCNEKRVIK